MSGISRICRLQMINVHASVFLLNNVILLLCLHCFLPSPHISFEARWNQLDFCILALDLVAAIGALSTNSWVMRLS
jgi:hypothetical protein